MQALLSSGVRYMRGLAAFVMKGRWQAVLCIAGLALLSLIIPFASLLSAAALGLVTLRVGARESVWVMLSSLCVSGVGGVLITGDAYLALAYGLLLWAPVWPVAIVLRESARLTWALELAALLGMLVVLGIYMVVPDPAQMWAGSLERFMQPIMDQAPAGFDKAQFAQSAAAVAHYMSGLIAAGSVLSLILGLLLARYWQAVLYNPGGFRSEFIALELHVAVSWGAAALILVSLLADGGIAEVAGNLCMVLSTLFLLAGFAVLHATSSARKFLLIGAYVVFFIIPQALVVLVFLGWSDVWLKWRKRAGSAT
jgi:hypothetical protein